MNMSLREGTMGVINYGRWLSSGIAAGVVIWLLEGAGSFLYMGDMEAVLTAHDLAFELSASVWLLGAAMSLIAGLTLMFFYVAARPRFGPGPRTAVIIGVALWFGSYLLSLIGYHMIGLYPSGMLLLWGVQGLVELILAALVGGWIYREA
jgi:hypothetical protein